MKKKCYKFQSGEASGYDKISMTIVKQSIDIIS